MLRKVFFLIFILSPPLYAEIIDLGRITRDTSTDLDWLDLTETNGISYNDIKNELSPQGRFSGWRYASQEEVRKLWKQFRLLEDNQKGFNSSNEEQYNAFVKATMLLGNTWGETSPGKVDGFLGVTGDPSSKYPGNHYVSGFKYITSTGYVRLSDGSVLPDTYGSSQLGSYLVRPSDKPIPILIWLLALSASVLTILIIRKRR